MKLFFVLTSIYPILNAYPHTQVCALHKGLPALSFTEKWKRIVGICFGNMECSVSCQPLNLLYFMSEINSTDRYSNVQKTIGQHASSSVQQDFISYVHWSKSFCFSEQCGLNSAGLSLFHAHAVITDQLFLFKNIFVWNVKNHQFAQN